MKVLLAPWIFITLPHAVLSASGFLEKSRRARIEPVIDVEFPKPSATSTAFDSEEDLRADQVREAIQHLWAGYKKSGWGADEVGPLSGEAKDVDGKVGMLILETLDTLWLAGLHKEFAEGEKWVSEFHLDPQNHSARTSFFEMTIRGLAGLLSAYALSGHHVFLEKATLLGDRLLHGFPQPGSFFMWPVAALDVHNVSDQEVVVDWHKTTTFLADAGSNVLEFDYLSDATGNRQYQLAADNVFNKMVELSDLRKEPLAPSGLDPYSLVYQTPLVTVGSTADSYFEYLLKRYLQSGCKEHHLLSAWKGAMREMREALLRKSSTGLTYIETDAMRVKPGVFVRGTHVLGVMEHFSCYVGGMLATAFQYVPVHEVEDWWLPTAVEITRTCFEMYKLTPTGLAPDVVYFDDHGMYASDHHYRLRPETLESLFYLNRITGNTTYRDWSWTIFQAINNQTKTEYGFATIEDVTSDHLNHENIEDTWMGAETLKYALLAQLPATALRLDKFVLNTEAHPLPLPSTSNENMCRHDVQ